MWRGAQLELLNMAKSGQLNQIWQSASTTHVQFNLVRGAGRVGADNWRLRV